MPPSMTPRLARRKTINALPNLFAVPIIFGHVFLSPYTKVEESFTLHAIYDVLAHPFTRAGLAKWDHLTFPGAVPRSFLPPIIIGLLSYPFTGLGVWLGWITSKVQVQLVVRAVLAALHCAVFAHLGKTIRARYGPKTRAWFMVLSLTQFHIPYYAARTLPNFLALDFVILSISLLLRVSLSIPAKVQVARIRKTVILLTATATILRLELALFLLPIVLSLVIQRKVSFMSALAYGVIGGLGSLAISAPVDYTLWLPTLSHPDFPFNSPWQLLWPEASALHYNIFQGNSAEWGVSPWYYYLVNAIPKISLASFPLALLGIAIWLSGKVVGGKVLSRFGLAKFNRSKEGQGIGEVLRLFGPGIVTLVAAMSCVGHKEWRFVIYIVPVLNVLAALAATTLWIHPFPRLRALFRLGLIGLIGLNLTFTAFSTFVSSYNYPGGEVWKVLDELYEHDVASIQAKAVPSVWLGNLAVQTGSSLFTFVHQPVPSPHSRFDLPPPAFPVRQSGSDWRYLKGQEEVMEDPEQAYRTNVDYIVTEDSAPFESWHDAQGGGWEVVAGIDGYGGIQRTGKLGLGIRWERKLAVVARK